MGYGRATVLTALACALAAGTGPSWGQAQPKAAEITVRIGKEAWTYTREQLLAMATLTLPNQKGTRENPAIPLGDLLFKDTGLSPDTIHMVFLIGNIVGSKILILRGTDLSHLDKLVLITGPNKGDRRHLWALAPKDEESYRTIAPFMGSPRKRGIYRIDIVPKTAAGK